MITKQIRPGGPSKTEKLSRNKKIRENISVSDGSLGLICSAINSKLLPTDCRPYNFLQHVEIPDQYLKHWDQHEFCYFEKILPASEGFPGHIY